MVPNLILAKVCRCDTIRFQMLICQLPPLSDIFTVRCFPIMSSSHVAGNVSVVGSACMYWSAGVYERK